MRKLHVPLLILAITVSLVSGSPAFATDGRTAVGKCIDTSGCRYHCDANGACTIQINGHTIWCSTPDSQCVTVSKRNPIKGTGIAAPIKPGKPVQAAPPKGGTRRGHPVKTAPITSGKPVQASPGTGTTPTDPTHPILERGGPSGKH